MTKNLSDAMDLINQYRDCLDKIIEAEEEANNSAPYRRGHLMGIRRARACLGEVMGSHYITLSDELRIGGRQ